MEKSKVRIQTSKRMSSIKGQNTKIEVLIRKKLWNEGYRYRIKSKIFGKPDIVYHSKKVVVFIDGDFWHAYNLKRIIKKEFNNVIFDCKILTSV